MQQKSFALKSENLLMQYAFSEAIFAQTKALFLFFPMQEHYQEIHRLPN